MEIKNSIYNIFNSSAKNNIRRFFNNSIISRFLPTDTYIISKKDVRKYNLINSLINIFRQKSESNKIIKQNLQALSKQIPPDGLKIIKKIAFMKNKKGKPRFSKSELFWISKIINKENLPYLKKLSLIHTTKGNSRFNIVDIWFLLTETKEKDFKFIKQLSKITDKQGNPILTGEDISLFLKNNIISMKYEEKQRLINTLKLCNITGKTKIGQKIKSKILQLEKVISKSIEPIPVSKKANNEFWENFLITSNNNNFSITKNLDNIINKYGKDGLPLEYTRINFIKDLHTKLKLFPPKQRTEILKKLNIELQKSNYEGFLNLKNLNNSNPKEAMIQKLCEKFILNNKVNTGDQNTDKFLNTIIKEFPEFINIIGKQQHKIHQYTLDGHTFKVLKEVISHPKFKTLSNENKMIIQLTALLHDIGKRSGIVDTGHEFLSAIIANDILSKINMPEFTKRKIIELIKNHNWLQQMNIGKLDANTACTIFRNPEDIKIAEIFAESDLKGVKKGIYEKFSGKIQPFINEIKNAQSEFYSTGNILFPTRILNTKKIPTVNYRGKIYSVLNIDKLPKETDLHQFGLSTKNKEDLRLLVHSGDIETLQNVTKPFNDSIICASMISPAKKTIFNSNIGIILDAPNSNIINSFFKNQCSGIQKNFSNIITQTSPFNPFRTFQRSEFIKFLSEKYQISKSDFKYIYNELISKQYLDQVKDISLPNGKTILAQDIKDAYQHVENAIMQTSTSEANEINLLNPKIKGVALIGQSIAEIPENILKFLNEKNLPIIILGNK